MTKHKYQTVCFVTIYQRISLVITSDDYHGNVQEWDYEMSSNPGLQNTFWVFFINVDIG